MNYSIHPNDFPGTTMLVYYQSTDGRKFFIGKHPDFIAASKAIDRYQEARRQAAAMGCRVSQ